MKRKQTGNNDDGLQYYFERIRKTALLTFEEECELSRRIQAGDETARHRLIESNLRLVVKIAKGFPSDRMSFLDLVQEGNLGLMKAATKYDFRKKVRFSTYASWWIKQSITRALANKQREIRLPHRKEDSLKKIQRAYNVLSQKFMRKPSVEEVAQELRMKPVRLHRYSRYRAALPPLTVNSDRIPERSQIFMKTVPTRRRKSFSEILCVKTPCIFSRSSWKKRSKILMYRFSFYGGKKYTLKSIGDELGISAETVRQIELRALRKLKEDAQVLQEYVELRA